MSPQPCPVRRTCALLCLLLLALLLPARLQAATHTVTNTNDAGAGSLRQAIADASDGDTIVFAAATNGTPITLASELSISTALTIQGNGSANTIIQANAAPDTATYRVMSLSGAKDITLEDLTLRHGVAPNGIAEGGGGIHCAVNDANTLTLRRVVVTQNVAQGGIGTGHGGGIRIFSGQLQILDNTVSYNSTLGEGGGIYSNTDVAVSIQRSSISNNTGAQGGGIYIMGVNTVTILNSTISNNTVTTTNGGGLLLFNATVTLTNCTVAGNSAAINGGGMLRATGTVNLQGTIVADNTAGNQGPDIFGTVESLGYNFIENTANATINGDLTGNITGQDPQLGALADNGGYTETRFLPAASPAYNAIPAAAGQCTGVTEDQRAYSRPQQTDCDMGAFELRYLTLGVTKSGTGAGSGTVTADSGSINCGATCSDIYVEASAITLTATTVGNASFDGWSGGGCSGTGTCSVTLDEAKSVTATFSVTGSLFTKSFGTWLLAGFGCGLLGCGLLLQRKHLRRACNR